jgi:ABC-type multidrug transport system fused ATPase/permease subunit
MKRDDRQFVVKNFRDFIQFDRKKLLIIFILTILFAFTQGAGYLMIIPLLKLLDFDSGSGSGAFEKFFTDGMSRLHFEPTLELILFLYLLIVSVLFLLQNRKSVIQSSFQHVFSGFLRKDLYKRILYSRWQDLTQISKVKHMQVLTSEIPKATHFFFYMLQAITKIIIIFIHVFLAFMVSWKLTVIIFVCGFLQFWLLAPFFKKSYEYGRTGRKTFRRVLKNIDDFWMTIKPAKIHRSEEFYFNNFSKADDVFSANQIAQFKHNQKPQLLYKFLGLINLVILILTANYFFPVSVPSLIVLVLLFGRILPLFINTFQDVNMMYFNAESLRSLQQLQLNACDTEQKSDSLQTVRLTSGISIENLDFSYSNNTTVFKNFNASVPSKKITGITGESGSGKTTLVDLICGLLTPGHGRILLDDVDIHNNNNPEFWSLDIIFASGVSVY